MESTKTSRTAYTGNHETATAAGVLAARMWLDARLLTAPAGRPWHAEITLDTIDEPANEVVDETTDTRFRLEIHSDHWAMLFCHRGRLSRVRVAHVPQVQGRDEYALLGRTPALKHVGMLLRILEAQQKILFRRRHAAVRTNLPDGEPAIRRWIEML